MHATAVEKKKNYWFQETEPNFGQNKKKNGKANACKST